MRSALKVTVPSELEGIAYIQVTIQRDTEQLVSATIGHFSPGTQKPAELHWQNKLEAAQNVLFCKELCKNYLNLPSYFHGFFFSFSARQGGGWSSGTNPAHGGGQPDHRLSLS